MGRTLDEISADLTAQQVKHARIRMRLATAHQELNAANTEEQVSKAKLRSFQKELDDAIREVVGTHE